MHFGRTCREAVRFAGWMHLVVCKQRRRGAVKCRQVTKANIHVDPASYDLHECFVDSQTLSVNAYLLPS